MKKYLFTLFIFIIALFSFPTLVKADEKIAIEKIEIVDSNTTIKVGEAPTFTAKLKNYADEIKIEETFMYIGRGPTVSTDESSSDADGLIKDYIYFYIIDLDIKDGSNLIFDDNTKFYVNGVEVTPSYVNENMVTIADESDLITPEGYVAAPELDKNFENAQIKDFEEKILKLIKEGKVTYSDDETKEAVENALANNIPIEIELYIDSMTKTQIYNYYEYFNFNDIDNAMGDSKAGAYYLLAVAVIIDGYYVGQIVETGEPVNITIPYPNGLPTLDKGYDRSWKIFRYHDGKVEAIDAVKTDNGLSFDNDKYSSFASAYTIVEKKEEITNPPTGDPIINYVILLVLMTISMFIILRGYIFIKKEN